METVSVWLPGGCCEEMPIDEAKKFVRKYWAKRVKGLEWERRKAGIDSENSREDTRFQHKLLRAAVSAALPKWRQLHLTKEQAAILCFQSALILTVGDE